MLGFTVMLMPTMHQQHTHFTRLLSCQPSLLTNIATLLAYESMIQPPVPIVQPLAILQQAPHWAQPLQDTCPQALHSAYIPLWVISLVNWTVTNPSVLPQTFLHMRFFPFDNNFTDLIFSTCSRVTDVPKILSYIPYISKILYAWFPFHCGCPDSAPCPTSNSC